MLSYRLYVPSRPARIIGRRFFEGDEEVIFMFVFVSIFELLFVLGIKFDFNDEDKLNDELVKEMFILLVVFAWLLVKWFKTVLFICDEDCATLLLVLQ